MARCSRKKPDDDDDDDDDDVIWLFFCDMVDQQKVFNLIASPDHCQRSSPSRISHKPRAGFEHSQNLSSGLVEWSCAVVITSTPRRHIDLLTKNDLLDSKERKKADNIRADNIMKINKNAIKDIRNLFRIKEEMKRSKAE